MNNLMVMPLSEVPFGVQTALAECTANFTNCWNELLTNRAQATSLGDRNRVEQIDSQISQMMALNDLEIGETVGERTVIGKIFGGPNGFAVISADHL